MTRRRFFDPDPFARLGIPHGQFQRLFRRIHVFFRQHRREDENLARVVEPLAPGCIGGQVVPGVAVNAEKVANGGAVFIAIQAADARGTWFHA